MGSTPAEWVHQLISETQVSPLQVLLKEEVWPPTARQLADTCRELCGREHWYGSCNEILNKLSLITWILLRKKLLLPVIKAEFLTQTHRYAGQPGRSKSTSRGFATVAMLYVPVGKSNYFQPRNEIPAPFETLQSSDIWRIFYPQDLTVGQNSGDGYPGIIFIHWTP